MRSISFRVENELPPKKDGGNSMWNKPTEARRLVALRHHALEALGSAPPFSQDIRLAVTVCVGSSNTKSTGDLDNFITGICDGLMQAHSQTTLHTLFSQYENTQTHPRNTVAIDDDSQIVEIHARKLVGNPEDVWYEVEISGD
ncbi:MAG: RusA family crossover junction endodeoxyribonuclease [Chloroflexota bacterium]|nr:RusA family crossover junction endodeoxyribonuclease [Chloroflexota bacterium]